MSLDGFHEWTPAEYDEKESAEQSFAPKPLLNLISTQIESEYEFDFGTHANAILYVHYHTAAQNALLSLLNFPQKLRPLLDAIVGMSMNEGNDAFSATDLELGMQTRVGKSANSEAVKKDFSRKKKLFREWQEFKNFQIIKISGRRFDAKRQRNEPTEYQVFITEWAARVVNLARKNLRDWRNRPNRAKAIRKAAIAVLYSLPECPPLEIVKTKTLSEEQLFNREDRYITAAMKRQRERLHRAGFAYEIYFQKKRIELAMLESNLAGAEGELLTPEEDEPQMEISVWQQIKSGEINDEIEMLAQNLQQKFNRLETLDNDRVEYAVQAVKSEEREITAPQKWENGKWSDLSNQIPTKKSNGQNSEIVANEPENSSNLLNLLNVEGTFLTENAETETNELPGNFTLDDVDDFLQKASVETAQEIVSHWLTQTVEKMPEAPPSKLESGVWQFYRFEAYTDAQNNTETVLQTTVKSYADGAATFNDLKTAFVDYAMARCEFWQNKQKTDCLPSDEFRRRFEEYLTLPEGFEDG